MDGHAHRRRRRPRPLRSRPNGPGTTARVSSVLGAALFALAPIAAAELVVEPGSIVRWAAPALESCELEGRQFAPRIDGGQPACFLPIDLLATGEIHAKRTAGGKVEELTLRVGPYPYDVQRLTIEDTRRVDPEPDDLVRIERENARIAAVWKREGPSHSALPLGSPLEKPPSAGRFGAKRILNGQPRSPHSGADYSAPQGTPVLAAADGEVVLAEEHFFSGNCVYIDHGDGLITMYFHLHETFVKPGQRLTRGAVLGTVGATGRATGPHLHFAVRWRGARVDPALLLQPPERLPAP